MFCRQRVLRYILFISISSMYLVRTCLRYSFYIWVYRKRFATSHNNVVNQLSSLGNCFIIFAPKEWRHTVKIAFAKNRRVDVVDGRKHFGLSKLNTPPCFAKKEDKVKNKQPFNMYQKETKKSYSYSLINVSVARVCIYVLLNAIKKAQLEVYEGWRPIWVLWFATCALIYQTIALTGWFNWFIY